MKKQTMNQISKPWRIWLVAAGLALFYFLPYAVHWFWPAEGRVPTGFLQYDMPYYMANATAHFDTGFRPAIANPSAWHNNGPALYAFPQNILLGAIKTMTGWSSGVVFTAFGLLAAVVFFRVALGLFRQLHGGTDGGGMLGGVLFCLGGGLLFVCGFVVWFRYWLGDPGVDTGWWWSFDPGAGLWFLNLGRNALYPLESLYHALFLGTIACVLAGKWRVAVGLAAVTAWCHPFTGVELLCVLLGAKVLDVALPGERNRWPWWMAGACLALLGLMLSYYFVYLPGFAEHRETAEVWKLAWELDASSMVPAYALVGIPAAVFLVREARRNGGFCFATKVLLAWFIGAFLLANHEWFFAPHQPLHFTRGYLWSPLFLLGWPVMKEWGLALAKKGRWGVATVSLGVVLFCLDNLAFITHFSVGSARSVITTTTAERSMIDAVRERAVPGDLFVPADPMMGLLGLTEIRCRAWVSHQWQTPRFEKQAAVLRRFQETGEMPAEWQGHRLWVCVGGDKSHVKPALEQWGKVEEVKREGDWVLWKVE